MEREIVIVLGKTGQGKSVWTRKYIEPFKRKFSFDPLMDIPANYMDESGLLHQYDNGAFEFGKEFHIGIFNSEYLELMGSLAFLSGNVCLTVEECAIAFPYGNHSVSEWLREVVFMGRHRRVSLILTAQRAISIPIIVRSQATRIVSFAQQEGADMKWLQDYFGSKANFIPDLPKLTCLDSHDGIVSQYRIDFSGEQKNAEILDSREVSYSGSKKLPEKQPENIEEFTRQREID